MAESHDLAATHLPLPGTSNLRDLGGLPAHGEAVTASRRLYRAELLALSDGDPVLTAYDPVHADLFRELGVRAILDLRSDREFEANPSAWPAATGAPARRFVFDEGGEGRETGIVQRILSGDLRAFEAADLAAFYCATIDRAGPTFVEAISSLVVEGQLPALIHCTAGKDRTGMLVALVLDLLGVPRDVVITDYAYTQALRPNRVEAYAPMIREAGVDPERVRVVFETPAEAMRLTLAHVDDAYGGSAAYLTAAGLDAEVVAALRSALLVRLE